MAESSLTQRKEFFGVWNRFPSPPLEHSCVFKVTRSLLSRSCAGVLNLLQVDGLCNKDRVGAVLKRAARLSVLEVPPP